MEASTKGGAAFLRTRFGSRADFSNVVFGDSSNFVGAQFGDSASFALARFGDFTAFRGVAFAKDTKFTGAHFGDGAYFEGAIFGRDSRFDQTKFGDWTIFSGALFEDVTHFSGASFGDGAWFVGAAFGHTAWFTEVRFGRRANFDGVISNDSMLFDRAEFGYESSFEGWAKTRLVSNLDKLMSENRVGNWSHYKARRELFLGDPMEFQRVSFAGARFLGGVSFNNRIFCNETIFARASFGLAPSFYQSKLHQDTEFVGSKFLDARSDSAERAYRALKLAMYEHHAHREEAMFFALELKARRHKEPWYSAWLYWLYEKVSDCGQSVGRPSGWLLGQWVLLSVALAVGASARLTDIWSFAADGEKLWAAVTYSALKIFPFLFTFRSSAERAAKTLFPSEGIAPWWIDLLAAFQTVIAIVLLFLIGLALRNRFRAK